MWRSGWLDDGSKAHAVDSVEAVGLQGDGVDVDVVGRVQPLENALVVGSEFPCDPDQDVGFRFGGVSEQPEEMIAVGVFELVLDDNFGVGAYLPRKKVRLAGTSQEDLSPYVLKLETDGVTKTIDVLGEPGGEVVSFVFPDIAWTDGFQQVDFRYRHCVV